MTSKSITPEVETRFLDQNIVKSLFSFEKDIVEKAGYTTISTIDNPSVMYEYLKGWQYWK